MPSSSIVNNPDGTSSVFVNNPTPTVSRTVARYSAANATGTLLSDTVDNSDGSSVFYDDAPVGAIASTVTYYTGADATGIATSQVQNRTNGTSVYFNYAPTDGATLTVARFSGPNATGTIMAQSQNFPFNTSKFTIYNQAAGVTKITSSWSGPDVTGVKLSEIVTNADGTSFLYNYNTIAPISGSISKYDNPEAAGTPRWTIFNNTDGTSYLELFLAGPGSAVIDTITLRAGLNATGAELSATVDRQDGTSLFYAYYPAAGVTKTITTYTGASKSGTRLSDIVDKADGTSLLYAYTPTVNAVKTIAFFSGTDATGTLTRFIEDLANGQSAVTVFNAGVGTKTYYSGAGGTGGVVSAGLSVTTLTGAGNPYDMTGSLAFDSAGNLFAYNFGSATPVVEFARNGSTYAAAPVLVTNAIPSEPFRYLGVNAPRLTNLTFDAAGNLFGAPPPSGSLLNNTAPTVFEIPRANFGLSSPAATIATLPGVGRGDVTGLVFDAAGDIFVSSLDGGASLNGAVFEIAKTAGGYATTLATLVEFNGANGNLVNTLIADAAGNLFGTTRSGGANNMGAVFEIPLINGVYASSPLTLLSLNTATGATPSTLIADLSGNLFGVSHSGGAGGAGTVFELQKNASRLQTDLTDYATSATILASFNGANGGDPNALLLDASGNVFGTTFTGGANGGGTMFEIAANATTPTTLLNFSTAYGGPSGLTGDTLGNMFGTLANSALVFEVAVPGFIHAPVNVNNANGTSARTTYQPSATVRLDVTTYSGLGGSQSIVTDTLDYTDGTSAIYAYSGGFPVSGDIVGVISNYSSPDGTGTKTSVVTNNFSRKSLVHVYNPSATVTEATSEYSAANGTGKKISDTINNSDGTSTLYSYNPTDKVIETISSFSGPNNTGRLIRETFDYVNGQSVVISFAASGASSAIVYSGANGTGSVIPAITLAGANDPFVPLSGRVPAFSTPPILVSTQGQSIDPGSASRTIQFIGGSGSDAVVLRAGVVSDIYGFNAASDFLDLRSLLASANLSAATAFAIPNTFIIASAGTATGLSIGFDPTGHGSGSNVALFHDLGPTASSGLAGLKLLT